MEPTADRASRWLEAGLALLLFAAPLPFGAVPAAGRTALEIGTAVLLVSWAARAAFHDTSLPPRLVVWAIVGLLGLGLVQALPLGETAVARLSPRSVELRAASRPPEAIRVAEARLLGVDPASLETRATLSVDPEATASALRTGAMLAALFFLAVTVAATRGVRGLAIALLASASVQGLYGMLVLASNEPRLWHVAKLHYRDSATGTFVNRNHFACYLGMALAVGLALTLAELSKGRGRWVERLRPEGARAWFAALLFAVGLAGLLTSFSRAGIAIALAALALVVVATGGWKGLHTRLAVALLVMAAALAPLVQVGADRLFARYSRSSTDLWAPGGRAVVWSDTLEMAMAFPWTGAGFGTFASAFPVFRSGEVRLFYAHAHNDPLQALAESGLAGAVLWIALLASLLPLIVRALGGEKGRFAIGFAAGVAVILVHAFVDFNLHIPANAATAAVLAGSLYGLPWKSTSCA